MRTWTGIALVNVVGHAGMVALKCTLCGGRIVMPTKPEHPATLDQLVDLIGDHLAVNHPAEYYGGRTE